LAGLEAAFEVGAVTAALIARGTSLDPAKARPPAADRADGLPLRDNMLAP
jgi:hypothetical protein